MSLEVANISLEAPVNSRFSWVDAAKGISIFLVVMVHSGEWLAFAGVHSPVINTLNESFATIQIPLFFCMSGLFAVKWLTKPWRELASRKLTALLWVFVMWQPVVFLYKYLAARTLPDQNDSSLLAHIARIVLSPLRPSGELWFLWALALFFVLAKCLSRLPVWVHLGIAAVVSASWWGFAEPALGPNVVRVLSNGWNGVFTYYLFFLVGVYGRRIILTIAQSTPKYLLIGVIALWAATEWFAVQHNLVTVVPIAYFFMKCLGLLCGISLALLIYRLPGLTWLGARTLPVYVAHTLFIVLFAVAINSMALRLPTGVTPALILIGVGGISIAASLAAHHWLERSRLGRYLYKPPARVETLVESYSFEGVSTVWTRR